MIDPADLDAIELAALISTTHLHGKPAEFVAAVLAECLSRLLINYPEMVEAELLEAHVETVRRLNEVNRALLPKDWRRTRYGHIP